jgi:prepilin-type processing-associated H-X9-DG protein
MLLFCVTEKFVMVNPPSTARQKMRRITDRQTASTGGTDGTQQAPRRNLRHAAGFTLTELLALVGIGAVLTGLLLSDLGQDRSKLLQEACASNMKQWGTVFLMYAHDYNGAIMIYYGGQTNYNANWSSTAGLYAKYWSTNRVVTSESQARMMKAKLCPAMQLTTPPTDGTIPGYSMIRPEPAVSGFRGFNVKDAKKPNQLLVMVDSVPTNSMAFIGGNGGGIGDVLAATNRHSGGANLLFCDGHVEWKPWAGIETNFTSWTSLSPP